MNDISKIISSVYEAFNARDIDAALAMMDPQVKWPKAFEGGYVIGHEEVKTYWTRQWKEISPRVLPLAIHERAKNLYEVNVHQIVQDLQGNTIFDGNVLHVYTLKNGLLAQMDVEKNPDLGTSTT